MGHLDTPGLVGEEEAQDQQQALVGIRDSYNKYKTNYKLIHRTKPERPIQDIYTVCVKGAVSLDFFAFFYFMNRSHLGP